MPGTLSFQELLTQSPCASLAYLLLKNHWQLATAESCTGGLIASLCTELPGSSGWLERGFVTYSNAAKSDMLGVDPALIAQHGAVSEEVARAMATGAAARAHVQVALAVTGIAGPAGGSPGKPVGTVWFGWATPFGLHSEVQHFSGDRSAVRCAAALHSLRRLVDQLVP